MSAGFESQSLVLGADQTSANASILLRMAQQTLEKHYPGHFWMIGFSGDGSMCYLKNGLLAGDMGIGIKVPLIYSASSFEDEVMRGGGELLERYRQKRSAVDLAAIVTLPTDFSGRHTPDV